MSSWLRLSIANAVVIGEADDAAERETCVRLRRTITPNPASMADPRTPKPTTRFRSLVNRADIGAATGADFLADVAIGADCLAWFRLFTMGTGCSCSQSRG